MADHFQVIRQFVQRLIEEKNFHELDQEILDQIASDLLGRVEDRINATILENMPVEKMEEFNALLDHADDVQIQEFCHENIPNLDENIAQALVSFREAYLNA
jgi:hypothetical protein